MLARREEKTMGDVNPAGNNFPIFNLLIRK
jgi:hypothetical protein